MPSTKELALTTGTSKTARYLAGLQGPVTLFQKSCNNCPLNFLCLGGHLLLPNKHISGSGGYVINVPYNFSLCKRCWCFSFETGKGLYVCARLRDGVFSRTSNVPPYPAKEYLRNATVGEGREMSVGALVQGRWGCTDYCKRLDYEHDNDDDSRTTRWDPEHPRNLSNSEREYLDCNRYSSINYRGDSIGVDAMDCCTVIHREASRGVWLR